MTKRFLLTTLPLLFLTMTAIPAPELAAQCTTNSSANLVQRMLQLRVHQPPQYQPPQYQPPQYQPPQYQPPQYHPPAERRQAVSAPTAPTAPSAPAVRVTRTAVVAPAPTVSETQRQAKNKTDVARSFFRTAQYSDAERHLNGVVKLVPDDTNAFQFRSLVLFAQGKHSEAAADAYDSLGMGNTWTVEVLDSIYPVADRYHQQLANLKRITETNPSLPTHFLLAYHYLMLNDLANGQAELEKVLAMQPDEPLTTQLLAAVVAKMNPVDATETTAVVKTTSENIESGK